MFGNVVNAHHLIPIRVIGIGRPQVRVYQVVWLCLWFQWGEARRCQVSYMLLADRSNSARVDV